MYPEVIDTEDAIKLLEECVAERGEDFVYPQEWKTDLVCKYSVEQDGEQTPACIVGLAIYRLTNEIVSSGLAANVVLRDYFPGRFTKSAIMLMETAQLKQDNGFTWREAVDAAISEM